MDNPEELTILSLCTGYGGLELGPSRALENPLRVVAVEVEAYAMANLVAKAEAGKLAIEALWPDLRTFPATRFRGCFDFIVAGYPCQGESVAGKQLREKDPRYLWPRIERIVEAVEPTFCFFENVANHLRGTFPNVLRSLRDMGYSVEAGLFTAAEVGAPHKRQRLFILAHTQATGPQGQEPTWDEQTRRRPDEHGRRTFWPARPGQPQYEWEEPRVVGNAKRDVLRPIAGGLRESSEESAGNTRESRQVGDNVGDTSRCGQAQSGVGRAVDGTRNRVDRLRLLGNGVVPQQAELGFKTLLKEMQE